MKTRNKRGEYIKTLNKIIIYNTYAEIELNGRRGEPKGFCKISLSDVSNVIKYKWCLGAAGYVYRKINNNRKESIHRFILNPPTGMVVDHINHNILDNRKENIRVCTHAQNIQNMDRFVGYSKYKGVTFNNKKNRYHARITINNKRISLGRFKSEIKAAEAYNNAAIKYYGKFAYLNIIIGETNGLSN